MKLERRMEAFEPASARSAIDYLVRFTQTAKELTRAEEKTQQCLSQAATGRSFVLHFPALVER